MSYRVLKLQQGGSFYTDYIPAVVPTQPQAPTVSPSASPAGGGEPGLFLDKAELKLLYEEGLPSDVEQFMSYVNAAQNDITGGKSFNPNLFVSTLNKINFNRKKFDSAQTLITSRDANSSTAITGGGQLYVVSDSGILLKNINDYNPEEDRVMTIQEVMSSRAYDVNNANSLSYLDIADNSTSAEDVRKTLDSAIKGVQNNTQARTEEELQVQLGIKSITSGGKVSTPLTELAINYLLLTLPARLLNFLKLQAKRLGHKNLQEGVVEILTTGILQGNKHLVQELYKEKADSENANGSGGNSSTNQLVQSFSTKVLNNNSRSSKVKINPETNYEMEVNATVFNGLVNDKDNTSVPAGTPANVAIELALPGIVDLQSASIGGVPVNASALNSMVYKGGKTATVDLPIDLEYFSDTGIKVPDMEMVERMSKAQKVISELKLTPDLATAYLESQNIIVDAEDVNLDPRFASFHVIPVEFQSNGIITARNRGFAKRIEGRDAEVKAFINSKRDQNNKIDFQWNMWGEGDGDFYSSDVYIAIDRAPEANTGMTVPKQLMNQDFWNSKKAAAVKNQVIAQHAKKYPNAKIKSSDLNGQ